MALHCIRRDFSKTFSKFSILFITYETGTRAGTGGLTSLDNNLIFSNRLSLLPTCKVKVMVFLFKNFIEWFDLNFNVNRFRDSASSPSKDCLPCQPSSFSPFPNSIIEGHWIVYIIRSVAICLDIPGLSLQIHRPLLDRLTGLLFS